MTVIVFANSKGGTGKTTTALAVAGLLAERKKVRFIDTDPARPTSIDTWAASRAHSDLIPAGLDTIASDGEKLILAEIERSEAANDYTIIDLEGSETLLATYAITQADLVVIPMQETSLDHTKARSTVAEVQRASKMTRSFIPYCTILTNTVVVGRGRSDEEIYQKVKADPGMRLMHHQMPKNEAFRQMIATGSTIARLEDASPNVKNKAMMYAQDVVSEILELIGGQK
jgi:chromosome partitioning protein